MEHSWFTRSHLRNLGYLIAVPINHIAGALEHARVRRLHAQVIDDTLATWIDALQDTHPDAHHRLRDNQSAIRDSLLRDRPDFDWDHTWASLASGIPALLADDPQWQQPWHELHTYTEHTATIRGNIRCFQSVHDPQHSVITLLYLCIDIAFFAMRLYPCAYGVLTCVLVCRMMIGGLFIWDRWKTLGFRNRQAGDDHLWQVRNTNEAVTITLNHLGMLCFGLTCWLTLLPGWHTVVGVLNLCALISSGVAAILAPLMEGVFVIRRGLRWRQDDRQAWGSSTWEITAGALHVAASCLIGYALFAAHVSPTVVMGLVVLSSLLRMSKQLVQWLSMRKPRDNDEPSSPTRSLMKPR